jgi:Ala-tRNA(Pro) deacylase
MPTAKLKKFLDQNKVRYVTIDHSPAFTAQEIAASAHIPGKDMAKTVMVNIDGEMAMAILPASYQIDLQRLRDALGARTVELANEIEFKDRFPECEVGAMPPFGALYGMPVYVADVLSEDEKIAFNAGTHSQLIQMAYADFERLAEPQKVDFTTTSTV